MSQMPAYVAGRQHLAAQEIRVVGRAELGMPLWFGANEQPRYRPKIP